MNRLNKLLIYFLKIFIFPKFTKINMGCNIFENLKILGNAAFWMQQNSNLKQKCNQISNFVITTNAIDSMQVY